MDYPIPQPGQKEMPGLSDATEAGFSSLQRRNDIEERYRLLVENIRDYAIFLLDPQGRIVTWNIGAERLKGYRQEEILGKHFSVFYDDEARQRRFPEYELEMAVKEGRFEDEGWRFRKDGTRFWANVIITALFDDEGRHIGFAKITRDLTERKMAEDAVRAMNEALEERILQRTRQLEVLNIRLSQSNRELEQFAVIASHDLQEPLRKVQIFGEMLENAVGDKLDETARDYIDRMRKATSRMQNLIDDLLSLSRLSRHGKPFEKVDLGKLLSDVSADLAHLLKASGGRLEVGKMVTVNADASQIYQLFQNLIENALRFGREGVPPVVRISSRCMEDFCEITVADNGIGFAPEHSERIFEIFERLNGRKYEGTGIGLAICRRIAERHGGTITAHGSPGRGATFTIRLPVQPPGDMTFEPDE